jgi:hypothetical protein
MDLGLAGSMDEVSQNLSSKATGRAGLGLVVGEELVVVQGGFHKCFKLRNDGELAVLSRTENLNRLLLYVLFPQKNRDRLSPQGMSA